MLSDRLEIFHVLAECFLEMRVCLMSELILSANSQLRILSRLGRVTVLNVPH
jgi:hypothetical protein